VPPRISGLSGGSQFPCLQYQPATGAVPLHVPSFVDTINELPGGSQPPL
jgi:hypothetical protein